MSDFALKFESCEAVRDYEVLSSEMENGAEQVRLKHETALAGWKFKSAPLTVEQAQVHQTFFDSVYGSATSFTWTYPDDGVEYTVRYVPGSFKIIGQEGYRRVEWEFKRVV